MEETHFERSAQGKGLVKGLVMRPIHWFRMLGDELHWSLVMGVIVVYGISQGFGVGLVRVSTQYYMKDDQKLQPSEAQLFFGLLQLPWIVKPLWGLLTDTLPVLGYRRRPYFIFAGFLTAISMLVVSLQPDLSLAFAMLSLMSGSTGMAISDVTIDACVTQSIGNHPSLAGDMQSLCGISSSIGSLVGFSLSGFLVHLVGAKGVFGFLSFPAGLVIMVGVMLRESNVQRFVYRGVHEKFLDAGKAMWRTLKCREVWRPCLFMFLSICVSLHIHEGMFYWYTDAEGGPSFSQEVVGSIFSFGAIGSLSGVLLYQNFLKNHPLRDIVFWSQLLFSISGLLDLMLVLRINLKLGLPDYFFVVIDEAVSRMIGRVKWMPLLVLSSKLCPPGIEGTFFALLMSIDHIGLLFATWLGGLVLHMLNVTRTQFDNLWFALLIRSMMRLVPLALLFLIPRSDPNSSVLPAEMLKMKKGDDDMPGNQNLEMASLIDTT
ncbi:Probable folate-biopterin transporter 3 [Linum perenne]